MPPRTDAPDDRYVIHDVIASGGMATIHLGQARGPHGFARTVAIKRMHEGHAQDANFVAMFLDEARIASHIRHTNVVATLDVVTRPAELWLVMDYIAGESLALLLDRTRKARAPMPIAIAAQVVRAALLGLHAAHEVVDERGQPLGIVHRDISPQNLLVGVDGVTRVVDFGIAKAAGRAAQTVEGQFKGKMQYTAPEQLQGLAVDRRADLFAAGAVLWECLASRPLREGTTEVEMLFQVLEGRAQPPSLHNPAVPPALDAIVLRALARSPHERFATAAEMALALAPFSLGATTHDVADWLESLAADRLRARAALVARVESLAPDPSAPPGRPSPTAPLASSTGPSPSAPSLPSASLPALDTSRSPVAPPPPSSRRALPALVALGVLAAVGVLVARSLPSSGRAPAVPSGPAPVASPVVPSATEPPVAPPEAASAPSPSASLSSQPVEPPSPGGRVTPRTGVSAPLFTGRRPVPATSAPRKGALPEPPLY